MFLWFNSLRHMSSCGFLSSSSLRTERAHSTPLWGGDKTQLSAPTYIYIYVDGVLIDPHLGWLNILMVVPIDQDLGWLNIDGGPDISGFRLVKY